MPFLPRRLLLVAALLAVSAQAAARPWEAIKKGRTIIVATEGKFAPFNFIDKNRPAGFEMDIAEAVAQKMAVRIEWKVIGFDALLTGLQQDRWDLVIASHGITDERAKAVTFAAPHYCTGGVIVSKNGAVRTAKDLAGKTVSVQTGTTYLDNVRKVPGVKEVKNFPQDSDARGAMETGRTDAWVTDRFVAREALAATPGTTSRIGEYLFVERVAAAVAKGNRTLVDEYDKGLAALLADGSYAKISQKWFKEDIRCR